MKKLVRDRIPEIIEKNGERAIVRILGVRAHKVELKKKLCEEAYEVSEAKNKKELVEELADVEEVLSSLRTFHGISKQEVVRCAQKKRKACGGFKKGIFLENVK